MKLWAIILLSFAATLGQNESIEAIKIKAQSGDLLSALKLAEAYEYGNGVETDKIEAAHWYMKLAEAGHSRAQNIIGTKLHRGEGVRKDPAEALTWYRKSAKQGNADAMFNLGTSYYNGNGVEVSDSTALCWFIAAEAFECADAHDAVQRSMEELRGQQLTDTWLNASEMLISGNGIPNRPEAAIPWLAKALEAGRADATVLLAEVYLEGKGVPKNVELAAEYCSQGAQAKIPRAYVCFGYMYRTGQGKPKDDRMAANWYGKAARCGEVAGIYRMSQLYGSGEGVTQDVVQQYAMLLIAANAIPEMQEEAARLRARLSEKDLRKAEKKARKFLQDLDSSCLPRGPRLKIRR